MNQPHDRVSYICAQGMKLLQDFDAVADIPGKEKEADKIWKEYFMHRWECRECSKPLKSEPNF